MSTINPRHSENVSNFGVLYSKVLTFGQGFNPSNSLLLSSHLNQVKTHGESVLSAVTTAEVNSKQAISACSLSFSTFDSFITRVSNTLNICGASSQIIEQGQSIIRQLHGKRVSALLTDEELAAAKAKGDNSKQNTIHNSAIGTKIDLFGKLITFLTNVPEYKPNEADLTIGGLTNKLIELKAKHDAVVSANIALDIARTNRKNTLYTEHTGLVDIALSVKQYVKAAFGTQSDQYKQISAIPFTNLE